MTDRTQIEDHKYEANRYASREDFRRIFSEDLKGLYQLSLLLPAISRGRSVAL